MQNRALSTCGQRPVLLCYTLFDKFARGIELLHRPPAAPPRHGNGAIQSQHRPPATSAAVHNAQARFTLPKAGLQPSKKPFTFLRNADLYKTVEPYALHSGYGPIRHLPKKHYYLMRKFTFLCSGDAPTSPFYNELKQLGERGWEKDLLAESLITPLIALFTLQI